MMADNQGIALVAFGVMKFLGKRKNMQYIKFVEPCGPRRL